MKTDWTCIENETRFDAKNCTNMGTRRVKEKGAIREKQGEELSKMIDVKNMGRGRKNSHIQKERERHNKRSCWSEELKERNRERTSKAEGEKNFNKMF